MRVACALITHLRAKVEMSRHPDLKDSPVLIVDRDLARAKALVVDSFPGASGLTAGMTLEQAMSRHANAVVLGADEPYYRRVFSGLLTALQGVGDRVEGAELGTAYVRIDGLEAMYRGEAGVVSTLLNAIPFHLNPRVGVAVAKFPAFVAARTRKAHGAFRVPDNAGAFLVTFSIDLLPVSVEIKIKLHHFGLHTMGAFVSMSESVLTDWLGSASRQVWKLSNGSDDTRVVPLVVDEPVIKPTSLPFRSSSIKPLLMTIDTHLKRTHSRLDMRIRYARATGCPAGSRVDRTGRRP
ncbi:MAG: hypothetical protein OXI33_13865 [Chloroflexota bacterium]|nr:hypothetical protein [Chloroflexota bacterium]